MMLLVRCPKCKNTMKYHTPDNILAGKRKKCVYCPSSFAVRPNLIKEI
ncbi:hypothetical protein HY492_01540 [Candidatus Woesearchaeota archaeon]|nr:hypothetical protein [Candidatus Woesearchaeota archaeon]